MNLQAIQEGLRHWFAIQTGIPVKHVHWAHEPTGMGAPVTAELSIVSTKGFGVDELIKTPQGEGATAGHFNQIDTKGHRALAVQFRVEARDGTALGQALGYCERARDRLRLPSSDALLDAASIGVNELLQCAPLPSRKHDNRMQTRAVLEIRFNATSTVTDEALQGTIGTARVGGNFEAGGATVAAPVQSYPVEPTP